MMDDVTQANERLSEWTSAGIFSKSQLENIDTFLKGLLDKKKVSPAPATAKPKKVQKEKAEKPKPPEPAPKEEVKAEAPIDAGVSDIEEEEEFLDISAVAITFDSGPNKGEQVELDVSFQSGNIISLIISSKDESLIENLKVGYRLDDVHFYSPIAIFRGSGVVSAMTQIKSGPKQGDYSLDIKIESI